ncbi:thiamine-phosphate kinase [Aquabacter sp. L1I39]|uniref:thiamine-phosphate kinase n=1 Tax=Aquabacter sp. L1I39 TaxID=2820278 RepID=UPI001ADC05C1|nr:thiamine-phosphate kinase [Aquabacter sp. L1I39]QTL01741.1 thiamine-phosphate kinase [Aquabacter sp. L1I39]
MSDGSGEDAFIARLFRPIARHPAARGLLDDAALLRPPPDSELVLTKDALVAGVHFFPDDPPASIARKLLRVNVSDLAAKGAQPVGALIALAVARNTAPEWLEDFAIGLGADCDLYGCPLLGGDTVHTPGPVTLSLTAIGSVPTGRFVPRTGARPNEAIIVTGTIGDSALGLALRLTPDRPGFAALTPVQRAFLRDRYLHPQPRLAAAGILRNRASAAMDLSDGLAGDVAKMLRVSGCGGLLRRDAVPLSDAARTVLAAEPALWEAILAGGDDYEIAACVPFRRAEGFISELGAAGIAARIVGETFESAGFEILDGEGMPVRLARLNYSHI